MWVGNCGCSGIMFWCIYVFQAIHGDFTCEEYQAEKQKCLSSGAKNPEKQLRALVEKRNHGNGIEQMIAIVGNGTHGNVLDNVCAVLISE